MTRLPLVLLDALGARPPCTGVAWSMVELVRALAERPGTCRFVVATRHPELFADVAGLPDWDLAVLPPGGGRGGRLLDAALRIPALARRLGADLIHSLTIPAAFGAGRPTLVTVHDIAFRLHPETVEPARRLWYRTILPASLRSAAAVLVNSGNTGVELSAHYPTAAARIRVTPFGTPGWTRDRARDPGELPQGDFLFVGALEPRKNIEGLLDAHRILRQRFADEGRGTPPRVRIIGAPGWRNDRILDRLAAGEADGSVRPGGYCGREMLWQEYCAARALLFPSLHEGFGFPILEAMSARLPVITSSRGAMLEVAGDAALLVDPESPEDIAEAMRRIIDDPELCARLARDGARRCLEWTWATTAERTLESYFLLMRPR
jgi:glycosyltransferase involved in cell wall biosynthesis